ncbi:MAG: phage protein [Acidimicrobiales bacterium]|nr:phage protein [Acidimicrobiales bacterium]
MTTVARKRQPSLEELIDALSPAELQELDEHLATIAQPGEVTARAKVGLYPVPFDWEERLKATFPKYVVHPFAERHRKFWAWVNAIELDSAPDPEVDIWPRGGGKSTGGELAAADLGCRDRRRYCLYVRETQPQADQSVQNVAALLESKPIEDYYPHHAERAVGKYGNSKGWKRERLTTAGGYVVDAVGLETATRGLKHEEQRPDLIIFDDIDGKLDSPATTQKKLDVITHSILPAGSWNCAVLFIQNLIIPNGVATRLVDGRADFLAKRHVNGPYPAVEGLKWEWKEDPTTHIRRAVIIGGKATWPGQPLGACQRMIDQFGLSAFLKECQHRVKDRTEGVVLRFDERHYIDLTDDECRALIADGLRSKRLSVFGGLDFGAWRFAFTLWVVTAKGVVIRIDEYFAQRLEGEAGLAERARGIHETCEYYGIPVEEKGIPIWGDSANPTDIYEINLGWKNGWVGDDGHQVTSRLRCVATMPDGKLRKTAVERTNNLLDTNTLRFRRGIAYEWRLGMNAGSEGTPQFGSRLVWEAENWSYGIPKAGEEQDQDPDDSTADGADMMASSRYGLMSAFAATKLPVEVGHHPDDRKPPFDVRKQKFVQPVHLADLLSEGGRKIPRVQMPRPRGR